MSHHQISHAPDAVPTILDLTDLIPPAETDGVGENSLDEVGVVCVLGDADADGSSLHETQFFEMFGSRAIC